MKIRDIFLCIGAISEQGVKSQKGS